MSIRRGAVLIAWPVLIALAAPVPAPAGDWPQWRFDAGRTAASPEELPARLSLRWTRQLPPPRPAWPKYPRLQFDAAYEPVVMGKTMFVPSMLTDSVTALDIETGAERWRFYAEGPVRFAPLAWQGKVYCVSDDGVLTCLDAAEGRVIWTFRGLPGGRKDRKVLGNERLISFWPARGGPVLAGGTVYFAAGIWPFAGVYIHAVDAETGKAVWSNADSGRIKDGLFDHALILGDRGVAGLAPQGYLTAVGEKLIVPCGRALPGFLDRKTGALEPYITGWGGRVNLMKGSWYAAAAGDYFAHTGDLCELATRAHLEVDPANHKELGEPREMVLTADAMYFSRPVNRSPRESYRPVGAGHEAIVAYDLSGPTVRVGKDPKREDWKRATFKQLWQLDSALKVHIKAGGRLYGGAPGTVAAVDIPAQGGRPKVSWQAEVRGTPARMLAADGKLFVVTKEGTICCFGPEGGEPRHHELRRERPAPAPDPWAAKAAEVLKRTPAHQIALSTPGKPTVAMRWDGEPVAVRWPATWQVFGPLPKIAPLLPGPLVATLPGKLTLGDVEYAPNSLPTVEDTLDFTCLYGGYGLQPLGPGQRPTAFPRPKARADTKMASKVAYALAEIDCPTAGRLTVGACGSGPMAWFLDGQCVFDPNSDEGTWPYYGFRGRMFSMNVSAGRHVLAAAVRAGRDGWNLTARGGAEAEADLKAATVGTPHTAAMEGHALLWGIGTGRLAEELARQSSLHLIVVDPDASKVVAFRRRLDAAGVDRTRVAVCTGDPLTFELPPYVADLIASEDLSPWLGEAGAGGEKTDALAQKIFRCLRPYGGVACLPVAAAERDALVRRVKAAGLPGAEIAPAGELVLLRRPGPLTGSTDWTHERGDAANSLTTGDRLVKVPLRVLWFGGSVDRAFPSWDFTHTRHPIPLVLGGREFLQQGWTLAAADVYTGRLLWQVALPAPEGRYHGYAAADDGVYVACAGKMLRLDPATGRMLGEVPPPAGSDGHWRDLRICGDLLVGRVGNDLVATDRAGGKALWSVTCRHEPADFAVGGGKAFLLDCPPPGRIYKPADARLIAADLRSGKVLWTTPVEVWTALNSHPRLAWAQDADLVVVQHRDLQAHNAATGEPVWKQTIKQAAPYVLHRSGILNARTGEMFDPLTGQKRKQRLWTAKLRGCSHAVASEYLVTVRDGFASFFDMPSGRRTFLRGLRSGCTPSLIPANGLLNIPNFAYGCACNYSIFTSLALVPTEGGED